MKVSVKQTPFGRTMDGSAAGLYTLTNRNGLVAKITNYGTIITELHVPDRHGKFDDVVLGFDRFESYLQGHPHFGCTVGRVANRIAGGKFTLDGKTYTLAVNNGPNHLHGGIKGFDKILWQAEALAGDDPAVKFTCTSPDGDEGYPGNLAVAVVMTLTGQNELRIDYTAVTDKPTPVKLTNSSCFNLAGAGDILGHELMLAADNYTPSDANLIPTGEIAPVKGTPLDFTMPTPIGSRFDRLSGEPRGYDHNFVLNGGGKNPAFAARVHEPESGRVMEMWTTEPGAQFYTGNFLDGIAGKNGARYRRHSAFCLEPQHFPDSVNQPQFPSIILRPGQTYRQTTLYKFSSV